MRVLSIAHAAVKRDMGRLRYHPLASRPDLDVHLLVPQRWHQFGRAYDADRPDDPGVTMHIQPVWMDRGGPMSWHLHFYPYLRGLIRRLRPNVIHLWEEPWSIVALQATLLKGDAPLVMEVDQNILKRLPPPFEGIRSHVLRHTAHVLSRSPDATAVVRAKGYSGPVSPIGYGIDTSVFYPKPKGLDQTKGGTLKIGYVGRLVKEKGLDDALDAIAAAPMGCSLAILGEGPYEAHLRRRTTELGLEGRVTFEGWRPAAEVAHFIRRLDALVLLTRTTGSVREQFGRVIIEAQACGIPVIGSACGAIPDVAGPGGWIIPESDPAALAGLLHSLCASPQLRAARSLEGLRNVQERFTYPAVANALAEAWISSTAGLSDRVERR
ncbi:MAG: glycosyltransferase [Beijerinckiaceae bacterium]|nr:glycosyltransferase [Beijerinckiaceae bacterium]